MAAVAHASPADLRRLSFVGTGAVLRPRPARVPTTVYRRRRAVALLVLVTAFVAVALALSGLGAVAGAPVERPGAAPTGVYVVQPGDTFWEIARRLVPGQDPRPLVAELVAAHGSATLVAGERLHLPDRR
jgi:nucleoid-associated protein YgaU